MLDDGGGGLRDQGESLAHRMGASPEIEAGLLSTGHAQDSRGIADPPAFLPRPSEEKRMSAAAMSCESMRPVLPLLREAAADRAETVGWRAGAPGPTHHRPASAPAHLLLLGDDPARLAEPLRRAFPPPEYRVQVAGSGPGGLRHVDAHPPDVIVLDLGLSEPSGLEVFRQIRRDGPARPRHLRHHGLERPRRPSRP